VFGQRAPLAHDAPANRILQGAADFDVDGWRSAFDLASILKGTPWAGRRLSFFSSSCNSGMHALYAAAHMLIAGRVGEVFVLAADMLSPVSHESFEVIAVFTDRLTPRYVLWDTS
jgi:hypothetical protein